MRVCLCEWERGKFLASPESSNGWGLVVLGEYEYEDPGALKGIGWVDGVLDGLGVTRAGVTQGIALMWLVDNHPEAVRKPFRDIRKRFYEPILKCEALLANMEEH